MTNIIQEDSSKINSKLVETISSYETIKGLNLEKTFQNKMQKGKYIFFLFFDKHFFSSVRIHSNRGNNIHIIGYCL